MREAVERYELGSDVIRAAGFSRINPRSNELYNVIFRLNSGDIDRVDIILGFGDIRDGRLFEVNVPDDSFSGFDFSVIPLSLPSRGTIRLGK